MSQKTAASRQKQTIANASMRKSVGTNTKEEMDAKTFSKKCKDFQARRNKMRANYSDLPTDHRIIIDRMENTINGSRIRHSLR